MSEPQPPPPPEPWRLGLSGKLMLLTVVFLLLTEILIFVPSVANFRNTWLRDRLAAAQTAALVIEAVPAESIPEPVVQRMLTSLGAQQIAMRIGGARRLIAGTEPVPDVEIVADMRSNAWLDDIFDSFDTLLFGGNRVVRLIGLAPTGGDFVEIVLSEQPLRQAMTRYARNMLLLSLLIAMGAAALVFTTLHRLIVRPVKRLSESLAAFGRDQRRIHRPSGRNDELGEAEQTLADMQKALGQQFQQQQRLAALGLAVAKINHDLRNMLSSAQLLSDRIASSDDPTVQRLGPKLVSAIDRAVAFCQNLLHFGRAEEPPPLPRTIDVEILLTELRDIMALGETEGLEFVIDVPERTIIRADQNQMLRVLMNLARNSIEAMSVGDRLSPGARLTVSARTDGAKVAIMVADNGPGIPAAIRPRLFQPFSAGGKSRSTGLGLAIAAELVRAQGGDIALVDTGEGTAFRLTLHQ